MSKRKSKRKRLSEAVDRLAKILPYGELLVSSDSAGFVECAADVIEDLCAALADVLKHVKDDSDAKAAAQKARQVLDLKRKEREGHEQNSTAEEGNGAQSGP